MNIFVLKADEAASIVRATHGNPHHILGMHECLDDCYVNVYNPYAKSISVVRRNGQDETVGTGAETDGGTEYVMNESGTPGLFTVKIPNAKPFPYMLKITKSAWGEDGEKFSTELVYDPYSFDCSVDLKKVMQVVTGEDDIESGFHVKELFGARRMQMDGVDGVSFCMNMPGAVRVSVVGDFNNWNRSMGMMRRIDYTDIYELFVPGKLENTNYKFEALYRDGSTDMFPDPYAVAYEKAPGDSSVLTELCYEWSDGAYMADRKMKYGQAQMNGQIAADSANDADSTEKFCERPINIYEVHMPTWRLRENGETLGYVEFAQKLAAYVKGMGYNYVQLMPLMEYVNDASWGYETTGMYAPTSRFGSPVDFMKMVDIFHGKGIGVIMDMVTVMDIDCISYWLDTYHLDGVRLEDDELVHTMRKVTGDKYDDVLIGLGWNTEGVSALSSYMMTPPSGRGDFADCMNVLLYGEGASGVWALSHDEVAYDKGSYASKMPGGYEDKYADLRILFGLTMALPGAKLTFMGQELGGFSGFDGRGSVDWSVLDFDANKYFQKYVKELNKLYITHGAFCARQCTDFDETNHVVSFVRSGVTDGEKLYIVCNFGIDDKTDYQLKVAQAGKYKEIFSSDNQKFGGEGRNNKGAKAAKKTKNGYAVEVCAPALSFAVFAVC